jgi:regulator of protease activity HflC (stomatin/prohibitin superfamily)
MSDTEGSRGLAGLHRALGGMAKYVLIFGIVGFLVFLATFTTCGMVIVENGKAAVLISKTGDDLPSGQIIATQDDQKGIHLNALPEGWYWRNPYRWDWVIVKQIQIHSGKLGLQIRNFGDPLPPGAVVATGNQKGILKEVLRPGTYVINPYAYRVVEHDAVTIEAGHVGVVTLMSGREPKNPNEFLVEPGERGIQKLTLPPGTEYPNPYEQSIIPIDIRSHRFDMNKERVIRFPSLDGFDISMEGTIEWYIDPTRVAEVYVKYVDTRPMITCIEEDIILPNARAYSRIEGSKHLARDFIGGITREKFQEEFLGGVKKSCQSQGIMIQSALVRQITPPDAIAKPIKDREIAIRLRELYEQQKERERQQKLLSEAEKMKERKTLATAADADVSVATTKANQEKEVAIIEANRQLEVAQLQLQAAQNQAEAKVAEGKAKADVIVYKNAAEASGLKNSALAFGNGHAYVRYLMNQKLAPSIQYILSNTDGPFADLLKRVLEERTTTPVKK